VAVNEALTMRRVGFDEPADQVAVALARLAHGVELVAPDFLGPDQAFALCAQLRLAGHGANRQRGGYRPVGFDGDGDADHGLHYVPESVYAADAARVVRGEPAAWTLKRNPRVTFRDCGARLFIDVLALRLRGVNGYLLPPGRFEPQFDMRRQFAVRPVEDSLPHFKSRPARFGGSDETVDW